MNPPTPSLDKKTCVLVVEDDGLVRRALVRALRAVDLDVIEARSGLEAATLIERQRFDAIVSDVVMPDMDGVALLRRVRELDRDVPVVLVTGKPDLASATEAVALGAFNYLTKPVEVATLQGVVRRAVELSSLARQKAAALEAIQGISGAGGLAALDASFRNALDTLWIAYQPILRGARHQAPTLYGHEAYLRCDEPTLLQPGALFDAAERLHRLHALGRRTRERIAETLSGLGGHNTPTVPLTTFVNVHPHDLLDDSLYDATSPLSAFGPSVVLEITERASLEGVEDLAARVHRLRALGYRIAIDDIGAGYAGLASFAALEPDVVKLDLTLIREIDRSPTRQRLVGSMIGLCRGMSVLVVAEGVETAAERDCLVELGCDLFQGFLFARPGPAFPPWAWS